MDSNATIAIATTVTVISCVKGVMGFMLAVWLLWREVRIDKINNNRIMENI